MTILPQTKRAVETKIREVLAGGTTLSETEIFDKINLAFQFPYDGVVVILHDMLEDGELKQDKEFKYSIKTLLDHDQDRYPRHR